MSTNIGLIKIQDTYVNPSKISSIHKQGKETVIFVGEDEPIVLKHTQPEEIANAFIDSQNKGGILDINA